MAGEKSKTDDAVEALDDSIKSTNPYLQQIKSELSVREDNQCLDGFGYYLFGIIEREMGMKTKAREKLVKACHLYPLLWAAWEELYKLCTDRDMLNSLLLPEHWMKDFFLAAGSLELLQANDALTYYSHLSNIGFCSSSYVNTQLALVQYHLKDFQQSAAMFSAIHEMDPYNLTSVDVYSHVLFVMEMLPELCQLAIDVESVDKYRSESCSVIGNFYSLNSDHEKACTYFRRAVRMDQTNHTSWILLGHEYLELKNHTMAIDAYARALDANKNDFRSYYGLGHTYELLKMPHFAISYYKMAHSLQPSDSRVLYALGYCYDQLEEYEYAKKCYKKAIAFHDPEGTSVIKLAKLHIKLGEEDDAAKLYTKFIAVIESGKSVSHTTEEGGNAHLYLARYHLRRAHYIEAEAHAHKTTEFVSTREEGKSLLQEVYKYKDPSQDTGFAEIILENEISPISSNQ